MAHRYVISTDVFNFLVVVVVLGLRKITLRAKSDRSIDNYSGVLWNYRGDRIPATIREIIQLCKDFHPGFLFLSETKSNEHQILKLAKRLNFSTMEVVPAVGTAGGFAIFWQDDMNLQVICQG